MPSSKGTKLAEDSQKEYDIHYDLLEEYKFKKLSQDDELVLYSISSLISLQHIGNQISLQILKKLEEKG